MKLTVIFLNPKAVGFFFIPTFKTLISLANIHQIMAVLSMVLLLHEFGISTNYKSESELQRAIHWIFTYEVSTVGSWISNN